jgi:hypothetical protein
VTASGLPTQSTNWQYRGGARAFPSTSTVHAAAAAAAAATAGETLLGSHLHLIKNFNLCIKMILPLLLLLLALDLLPYAAE